MCFLRNGAIAHRAGLEPLHDAVHRFHLVEGKGRFQELEIQQPAQGAEILRLIIDQVGVFAVDLFAAETAGRLELVNRLRIEQVMFPGIAPLVLAAGVELFVDRSRREGPDMPRERFLGNHVQTHALNARRRPGEIFVHDLTVEADSFKDLRATIALDRGDAHLGHGLHHALDGGLDEFLDRRLVIGTGQQTFLDEIVNRLIGEVRINGAATVTNEQREMMHFAGFAGFQHQTGLATSPGANQIMMQAGHGQQRGNGRVFGAHIAVGQNDDIRPTLDGGVGGDKQGVQRLFQTLRTFAGLEKDGQRDGFEAWLVDLPEFFQLFVGENRLLQADERATLRSGIQETTARTDHRVRGRDDFFADRINRRVRDLREQLLEIVIQQLRLVREHRQWRVRAHRAQRLHAIAGHGADDEAQVFKCVAKRLLMLQNRDVRRMRILRGLRQVFQQQMMLVQPGAIGMGLGIFLFQLLVRNNASLLGINEEHAARLEAALDGHALGFHRQHAGFGSHDHDVVLRHIVTRRPQTIAVQTRANADAIGERHGGGTVPRLNQAGMKFVERAAVGVHALMIFPRFGNHHHHGVRQFAAGHDEQFHTVVKLGGVAAVGVDHGHDLLDVGTQSFGFEVGLGRLHPVHIAAQRIDFAVVRDEAVRMRTIPARERVRGKT